MFPRNDFGKPLSSERN